MGPKGESGRGWGARFSFSMHDLDRGSTNTAWGCRGSIVMTANERSEEIDQAIRSLEGELTSRRHAEAGRDVLGKVLAALWALRTEAADQPGRMLH